MKKTIILLLINIIAFKFAFSQGAAINASGNPADPSAILDVSSFNKGVLVPRIALLGTNDVTLSLNRQFVS